MYVFDIIKLLSSGLFQQLCFVIFIVKIGKEIKNLEYKIYLNLSMYIRIEVLGRLFDLNLN